MSNAEYSFVTDSSGKHWVVCSKTSTDYNNLFAIADVINQLYELKRRVDVIYEALELLLGEDLEKALERLKKDETAKRSEDPWKK